MPFSHDIYSFYVLSPARLFDAVQLFQLVKCKFCRRSQLWLNVAFSFSSMNVVVGANLNKKFACLWWSSGRGLTSILLSFGGCLVVEVQRAVSPEAGGIPRNWNFEFVSRLRFWTENVFTKTTREQSKLRPFKCIRATAWHAIDTPAPNDVELKYWWEFIAVLHDKSSPSHRHMADAKQRQSKWFTAIKRTSIDRVS